MLSKILRTIFIIIPMMTSTMLCQTDSLNIFWDKNSESDMYRYRLERSVNSSNFQFYLEVSHPDTHGVDRDVQPGNLYAYRVAAMDSAGNLSGFSIPDSVGIPAINWPVSKIVMGQDTFFTNLSFLSDPDGPVDNLQLSVSQENNVISTVQNNGIQISPLDTNYIGPAFFVLRAEDSDGLYDLRLVQFNFYDPNLQNTPPHLVNLPDTVHIAQNNSFTFNLVNFLIDSTHNISEVSWEFEPGANINFSFDSSLFRLSIAPDTNWVGISTMGIEVTDPLGLSDEKTLIISVEVGIEPRSTNKVIVYPNPCVYQNGHTEVIFDNLPEGTQKFTLFNILGQKVFERSFSELNNPYHLRAFDGQPLNLPSGFYIYLFQAANNQEAKTGMFVVVR